MDSTVQGRTVSRGIETQLNDLLLGGRASLPRAANHRPIAPVPKVAQTRKLIVQGLCCPFRHLLDLSTADLDDGVPLSEVLAPYRRMIAYLETRAADRHLVRHDKAVPVLLLHAAREINEYELAALRLANSPESVAAYDAVIKEAADVGPILGEVERGCHLQLARSVMHRPSMQVTR